MVSFSLGQGHNRAEVDYETCFSQTGVEHYQLSLDTYPKSIAPQHEKTGLKGFWPGLTQTELQSQEFEILDLSRKGTAWSL